MSTLGKASDGSMLTVDLHLHVVIFGRGLAQSWGHGEFGKSVQWPVFTDKFTLQAGLPCDHVVSMRFLMRCDFFHVFQHLLSQLLKQPVASSAWIFVPKRWRRSASMILSHLTWCPQNSQRPTKKGRCFTKSPTFTPHYIGLFMLFLQVEIIAKGWISQPIRSHFVRRWETSQRPWSLGLPLPPGQKIFKSGSLSGQEDVPLPVALTVQCWAQMNSPTKNWENWVPIVPQVGCGSEQFHWPSKNDSLIITIKLVHPCVHQTPW